MNILEKRPELKAILGKTGKEEEFRALLSTISADEVTALNHYLNKALSKSELDIWHKQQNVRCVETQIKYLKNDYNKVMKKLKIIRDDLKTSFNVIYKEPQKAEEKCIALEQTKGLIKTGWIVRNIPNKLGNLKGFSFLGVINSQSRVKAKETANFLDYENMRKTFNEGKKVAVWLGHIVKGV